MKTNANPLADRLGCFLVCLLVGVDRCVLFGGGMSAPTPATNELAVLKQNLTAEVVMRDIRIGELTRAYEGQKAEAVWRGKLLIRLREQMILIRDGIDEDAPDRTYFASTNDADTFKEIVESLDEYKWDRILAEKNEPDILEKCRAANLRADTAEATVERLTKERDVALEKVIEASAQLEILGHDIENLRAALAKALGQ